MLLRVVAPQTPVMIDGFWEGPQNLTYFLLASLNLEDEIHFKGGRFVTSQNSKFWNVTQIDRFDWLFDCYVIDWVKFETFWKLKWEGIKGLSQIFIFFSDLHKFKFFSNTKPLSEDDMTSSI